MFEMFEVKKKSISDVKRESHSDDLSGFKFAVVEGYNTRKGMVYELRGLFDCVSDARRWAKILQEPEEGIIQVWEIE